MTGLSRRWRGLLVSVRDAAEAVEAVAGGADIVDVKEPAQGPLGAAAAGVAADVASAVGGRVSWTLACGELADGAARAAATARAAAGAAGPPAAAKAGPAGLALADWRRAHADFAAALPRGVEAVAVAYADWAAAAAPDPDDILDAAAALGCRTLLVDTFDKAAGGVLAPPFGQRLPALVARARGAGLNVAVAGRLALADVATVAAFGVDVVAVRSAACRGGRLGRVDRALVAAARAALASCVAARG